LVEEHISWYSNPASSPQALELLRDKDDRFFVNYLEATNYAGDGPDWEVLARHRDLILSGLRRFRHNARVRPKYEWLREYHDHFCTSDRICYTAEWGPPPDGFDSLLIAKTRRRDRPSRFSQIVEGDSHVMSLKARPFSLPSLTEE